MNIVGTAYYVQLPVSIHNKMVPLHFPVVNYLTCCVKT